MWTTAIKGIVQDFLNEGLLKGRKLCRQLYWCLNLVKIQLVVETTNNVFTILFGLEKVSIFHVL